MTTIIDTLDGQTITISDFETQFAIVMNYFGEKHLNKSLEYVPDNEHNIIRIYERK